MHSHLFIKGNVIQKRFNSFCKAEYGSQLWNHSTKAPEVFFYISWRKCLWCIDGLPNKTHTIILYLVLIHVQLHTCFVNFVNKNAKTGN